MSKTIRVDVMSPESIEAAVRELRDYAKWVESKAEELRKRVAYLIATNARDIFNYAQAEDLIGEGFVSGSVEVKVKPDEGGVTLVIADGEDAVFMEFGAGVYHNGPVGSSPNPLGADLGFTIGSYRKSHPEKEVWGFYGADGKVHITHGTPASMPLYRSVQAVVGNIVQIAREVFNT